MIKEYVPISTNIRCYFSTDPTASIQSSYITMKERMELTRNNAEVYVKDMESILRASYCSSYRICAMFGIECNSIFARPFVEFM